MQGRKAKKLNPAQVARLKQRWQQSDMTQQQLAQDYGISQSYLSSILAGKHYPDVPPIYDPTAAMDPATGVKVFLKPEPKPLPREDGETAQRTRRSTQLRVEGAGIRPCLSATSQWLGCPYVGSETLCAATEKEVNGKALWLACILKPGIHVAPEGYYPPKPKVQRVIEAAKQTDLERRRKHTKALTVQKAVSKREPRQHPLPKTLRMKQFVNGAWVTRVFENGVWTNEPTDRQTAQPTAG